MDVSKKKVLLACSLVDKNNHFDGERRKSSDILKVISDKYYVSTCNFTKNKYIQTLKFIFLVLFCKFDFIFIAKAPTGGNFLLSILRKIKYNPDKIAFYTYGRGFTGIYEKKIKLKNVNYPRFLICECLSVKKELIDKGLTNSILVFPTLKKIYDFEIPPFEHKECLKGVFISRICEDKGVLDLLEALKRVNRDKIKFKISFSGAEQEKHVVNAIKSAANSREDVVYLGESFSLNTFEDYSFLSTFDVHFFPTKFFHDCVPGSAVDAFISCIPTICSKYSCAYEIFDDNTAFFFDFKSIDDLVSVMEFVYNNQKELYDKKISCKRKALDFGYETFSRFFDRMIS